MTGRDEGHLEPAEGERMKGFPGEGTPDPELIHPGLVGHDSPTRTFLLLHPNALPRRPSTACDLGHEKKPPSCTPAFQVALTPWWVLLENKLKPGLPVLSSRRKINRHTRTRATTKPTP